MTDKQALYEYRLSQAETTLDDAKKMLQAIISPRSDQEKSNERGIYLHSSCRNRAEG